MRRASKLILCFVAVWGCSQVAFASGVVIPDWVRQAAAEKLPAYSRDTNAVVLLDDETDTVTGAGEFTEHHRRVVRILRPEGRKEGKLSVYIGHQEKLASIHAWSIDAAGHEYELKEKDFEVAANAYKELYSDVSHRLAIAPAADPGTVVGFEYEVRRHNYFNELDWSPQEDIPVHRAVFTVQLPSGWELKDFWSGMQSEKSSAPAANGWQWTKYDLPEIEDEPARPPTEALAGRLTVAIYTPSERLSPNWGAISDWAAGLFRVQRTVSPEMSAKVTALVQGKTDFDSRVRALTNFVQANVRYYGIEIGIGGYQPHPASDVFRLGYGDCKDKANLLSTLLGQAGINSEMVLIHTDRGVVRPELPSSYFNHAIVAIQIPDGVSAERYSSAVTTKSGKRYVIFDPTDEWMPFGEVRSELQGSYALIVSDKGGELIQVPVAAPSASELVRSARMKLTPDGRIDGSVQEKLTGDFAEEVRMGAESADQGQRVQHYERQVAHWVKNANIQGLALDGLKDLNGPVAVHYDLSADRYAQIMGPLMIVRPRVLGTKSFGLEHKPRKYPLVLGETALETDDFELDLPPGYVVDDKPDPVSVDSPWASYKSRIEVDGSKLHYSREYVQKVLEVPPDKIEELRAFENKVSSDENAAVVLKKTTSASGQD